MVNNNLITLHDDVESRITENILALILKNQTLLKCLKYESSEALFDDVNCPDITDDEKLLMTKQDDEDNCRIFVTPYNNQIISTAKSQLRFFIPTVSPENSYLAELSVDFEIIVENRLWRMDGGIRPSIIRSELLKTLNGQNVDSIGNLIFNTPSRIATYNDNFTGYQLTLKTRAC